MEGAFTHSAITVFRGDEDAVASDAVEDSGLKAGKNSEN